MEGCIWLVVGLALSIASVKLHLGNLHKPGPGFLPFLSGACLALCGLILMLSPLAKGATEESGRIQGVWGKSRWKKFLLPLLILTGYVLLLDTLGFPFASFLFLFFLFKMTDPRKWFMPLFLAGSTVVLSYLLFSVWLQCQFPKGVLFQF
jgi:putative tricarboxylic transport membrane protein